VGHGQRLMGERPHPLRPEVEEERVELRSSGRSWSESDRGRGGKATSDRMVNERFFCNDRDAKQPFEHTIDKGFGLVILASFADPSVTVALWHLRIVFGI
jgi:hypothetical protein